MYICIWFSLLTCNKFVDHIQTYLLLPVLYIIKRIMLDQANEIFVKSNELVARHVILIYTYVYGHCVWSLSNILIKKIIIIVWSMNV
jgi:hypothetical protein